MALDEVFVRIPEGWFQMGSDEGPDEERPVHRVWVEAFDFAVYPVTCRAYALFLQRQRPRAAARLAALLHDPRSSRGRRELVRLPGLLPVACVRRLAGAAADRSGVGARRAGRDRWADVSVGQRDPRVDPGGRPRPTRGAVAGHAGGAESVRAVRHRRERARVVRGLVRVRLLSRLRLRTSQPGRRAVSAAHREAGHGGTRSPSAAAPRAAGSIRPTGIPITASVSLGSGRGPVEGGGPGTRIPTGDLVGPASCLSRVEIEQVTAKRAEDRVSVTVYSYSSSPTSIVSMDSPNACQPSTPNEE